LLHPPAKTVRSLLEVGNWGARSKIFHGTIHTSPVWVSRDHADILLFMDPADPYHWMAIQGVVVKIIDEDDPVHGTTVTESLNEMSQSYLGTSTYPLRDPAGGEVRSLYRVRPDRAQVFGHT